MTETTASRRPCDDLRADLAEAAFRVAARHGVNGPSVDRELELWRALGEAVPTREGWRGRDREERLAELADAAYDVVLRSGFRGSFLDLRLDLWAQLRRALRPSPGPGRAAPTEDRCSELTLA